MTLAALSRADYALLVSLGSMMVAASALGFQLYNALRIDRAIVKVAVDRASLVGPGLDATKVIAVEAVNHGKRPTTVTAMLLIASSGRLTHRRVIPRRWRRQVGFLVPVSLPGIPLPELPATLDVGGRVQVYFGLPQVQQVLANNGWKRIQGQANATSGSARSRLEGLELPSPARPPAQAPDRRSIGDSTTKAPDNRESQR